MQTNPASEASAPDSDDHSHRLPRTFRPYIGQTAILTIVTIFWFLVAIETREWRMLFAVPVLWLLFAYQMSLSLRYRISWGADGICQEASGGRVCVAYDEITKVAYETAKPGEYVSATRPFRRIAIYADTGADASKVIDVSLKHFSPLAIGQLVRTIGIRRPELSLPKHWA